MPTADEFDSAARIFGSAAEASLQLPSPLATAIGPDVVRGGRLTAELAALIRQTEGSCAADSGRLNELAETCHQRAALCREYSQDMSRFHDAERSYRWERSNWEARRNRFRADPINENPPGLPPRAPSRPRKKHSWIDA